MKILRVIPSMNPTAGGPCQGIRNSIPALAEIGIDNEVVCLDNPKEDFLGNDSFCVHAIGKAKGPWNFQKKLIPWLLLHLNEYDIVVVHGLWSYHSHAAMKALKKYRKQNINSKAPDIYIMPHGMLDPYFQQAKDRKLKAIRNTIYWRLIENTVINEADGLLFTCEEELLLARKTFPNYHPKKEINVGYGIQAPPSHESVMDKAFESKLPNWNKKPFILFLSRIHQKKGVDLLIDAYLKLENEIGEIPQLIIAGPGLDQEYGLKMVSKAAQSKNILLPGMLKGESKWGAFYNCEVFILPSHQENFGIAVVEALACSVPVLISNKVNIWREIKKGDGGMIGEDSLEATFELLKKWVQIPSQKKKEMKTSAKRVYQTNYKIQEAAKQFVAAFQ